MQLIKMNLEWESSQKVQKMEPEAYQALRIRIPEMELPEDQSKCVGYWSSPFIGTVDELQYLSELGLKVEVSRVRGLLAETLPGLGAPPAPPGATQVVNVTIPGIGLFSVQRLEVLENSCTDVVQGRLNEGWRIVAVCPPNDTRRPTYVMGHADKEPRS